MKTFADKLRELLGVAEQKIGNAVQYFNPTSNNGQNFWSTPVANTLVNVQQNVVKPIGKGVQNIKNTPWQTFTPLSMKSTIVPDTLAVGEGVRRLSNNLFNTNYTPQQVGQVSNLVGHGIRGALSVTPFQAFNSPLKAQEAITNPQTAAERTSEKIGRGIALTAMTSPLGGGALKMAGNALIGTGLGTAIGAGTDLLQGKPITKSSLMENAAGGFEFSGIAPLSNAITELALARVAPQLTSKLVTQPFAVGQVKEGFKRLFLQALADSPVQNTAMTILGRLDQESQNSFMKDWLNNMPSTLLMNVGTAGIRGTWNTAINRESRTAVVNALQKTIRDWTIPVTTTEIDPKTGKRVTMTMLEYRLRNQPFGNSIQDVSKLTPEDYKKVTGKEAPPEQPPVQGQGGITGVGEVKTPQIEPQPQVSSPQVTERPVEPVVPETKNPLKNPSLAESIAPGTKERGFVSSVKESPNVTKETQAGVSGTYKPKSNVKLMGEAKVLLENLPEGSKIDFKNVKNIDQKVAATIQEAINQDKLGNHDAAANLYNNLARYGTELGRGVHAYSLLDQMSPEAISKSVAARIQEYNKTAWKKIPELTGEQQKIISDGVKAIDALPEGRERNIAINRLMTKINEFIPSSITDKIITTWKAGLLTSLRTHERNLLGNTIMGASEVAKDVVAAPMDWLMSKKTGQRTLTFNLKTGEGLKQGLQSAKDIVTMGFDPEESISKFEIRQINWGKNPVEQALKKYTDAVFRTLGAEDKPFWKTAYARSLYDQAGAMAINAGKAGDKAFIENLVKNPTEQMLTTATKDANYATFHDPNKLSGLASSIKRWAGQKWYTKLPAEVVAPFTGVPSSIAGKTVSYSPIGLVRGAIDVGRVMLSKVPMPELQRQAAQEVGRGVMGTGLFALGAYLMSKGLMTGQPKDAAEAHQWQLENKPSNSVLIGGKWRSINSIGPQNLVLLAGAKYNEEMSKPDRSVGAYAMGLGKDQLNQTFLAGIQQPLAALTDPTRYGKSYVGNLMSSPIPNFVKDTSKAFDPYAREMNSSMDYIKASIPGVRNTMLPKRDVLGNIIPQEPTGINAYIDLFNSKTPIHNQVVDELARLNNIGSNATPGALTKNQTINGVKQTLTPEQLNALEAAIGPEVTAQLQALFNSSGYKALSDEDKANAINSVVTQVRKKVRGTIDLSQTSPSASGSVPTPNMASTTSTSSLGQYILVNPDTGSVKNIDLSTPIEFPILTGDDTIDKKLISSYKSALSTRMNDIIALYQDNQISLDQAKNEIAKLQSALPATNKTKSNTAKKINVWGTLKAVNAASNVKLPLPKVGSTLKAPILRANVPAFSYKGKPLKLKVDQYKTAKASL